MISILRHLTGLAMFDPSFCFQDAAASAFWPLKPVPQGYIDQLSFGT
jgi:hypothetical protein